jgi:hypothetical protein
VGKVRLRMRRDEVRRKVKEEIREEEGRRRRI